MHWQSYVLVVLLSISLLAYSLPSPPDIPFSVESPKSPSSADSPFDVESPMPDVAQSLKRPADTLDDINSAKKARPNDREANLSLDSCEFYIGTKWIRFVYLIAPSVKSVSSPPGDTGDGSKSDSSSGTPFESYAIDIRNELLKVSEETKNPREMKMAEKAKAIELKELKKAARAKAKEAGNSGKQKKGKKTKESKISKESGDATGFKMYSLNGGPSFSGSSYGPSGTWILEGKLHLDSRYKPPLREGEANRKLKEIEDIIVKVTGKGDAHEFHCTPTRGQDFKILETATDLKLREQKKPGPKLQPKEKPKGPPKGSKNRITNYDLDSPPECDIKFEPYPFMTVTFTGPWKPDVEHNNDALPYWIYFPKEAGEGRAKKDESLHKKIIECLGENHKIRRQSDFRRKAYWVVSFTMNPEEMPPGSWGCITMKIDEWADASEELPPKWRSANNDIESLYPILLASDGTEHPTHQEDKAK